MLKVSATASLKVAVVDSSMWLVLANLTRGQLVDAQQHLKQPAPFLEPLVGRFVENSARTLSPLKLMQSSSTASAASPFTSVSSSLP